MVGKNVCVLGSGDIGLIMARRMTLEGVKVAQVDENRVPITSTERFVPCDTLLLSVGLIPENELTRQAGVEMDPITGGAIVDDTFMTNVPLQRKFMFYSGPPGI